MGTLTAFHVLISLAGIASGFVVIFGLLGGKRLNRWTVFFLATTVLTSATGYLFPVHKLMPSHIVGALSLLALALAIYARYRQGMNARWRSVYVAAAILAQYFNVFVLVVQSFLKIPSLKALAPTQSAAIRHRARTRACGLYRAGHPRIEEISHRAMVGRRFDLAIITI